MKKLFFALPLIIFLMMLSFAPVSVFADGMAFRADYQEDEPSFLSENNQQAFISYENGFQKMILSIGLDNGGEERVVWLFPVPADPNRVAIDVVKSYPSLRGDEIFGKAKSNLSLISKFLQLTQFYTLPFISRSDFFPSSGYAGGSLSASSKGLGGVFDSDVIVYEHLEKDGISSEVITAKTANGLYDYLKNKGLNIEAGSIPVLENYIGKNYSFVVSWISLPKKIISSDDIKNNLETYFIGDAYPKFFDLINILQQKYPDFNQAVSVYDYLKSPQGEVVLQELISMIQNDPSVIVSKYDRAANLNNQRGVFVTFPTDKIYFPLLPTSVYGSKIVPATIRVLGYVSPKVFQDIKGYTKTEYYFEKYAYFNNDLKGFYNGKLRNLKYTNVAIDAPSKFLTDDLWFSDSVPAKVHYSTFTIEHPWAIALILFVLSSVLAGISAGLVVFKDLRKKPIKLGLIGLSNIFMITGLLITTVLVGTKNIDENSGALIVKMKQKGYLWKRRVAMAIFLIITPLLIIFSLSLPVVFIGIENSIRYKNSFYFTESAMPLLIFYIILIVIFVTGLVFQRVKAEDKDLFRQLKALGCSSWSFHKKDKMKILFVPLFSVFFLIISWVLVETVKTIF